MFRPSSFFLQQKIKESQWKLTGFYKAKCDPSEVWEFFLWSWQTGISIPSSPCPPFQY